MRHDSTTYMRNDSITYTRNDSTTPHTWDMTQSKKMTQPHIAAQQPEFYHRGTMRHDLFMLWDMTLSYLQSYPHVSSWQARVPALPRVLQMRILAAHVRHDSFIRVTWRIHMCDMTHTHVWPESFGRETWLVASQHCACATWLIHTCDMTYSYVWHD